MSSATEQPLQLILLLEEKSAQNVLDCLLSKILPLNTWLCIPHQGKGDLQKSIPKKLRGWQNPNAKFIIVHDQDSHDCYELKQKLKNLCEDANKPETLIRIVCVELEAWYWGDLEAVAKTYSGFKPENFRSRSIYRHPDSIHNPANKLKRHIEEFDKTLASTKIPQYMDIDNNTSPSFNCLIQAVKQLGI